MTSQVQTPPSISLTEHAPPAYKASSAQANDQAIPRTMSRSSLSSETSSLPAYEDEKTGSAPKSNPDIFTPTTSLQIETPGKDWLSLPLPLRPDPIPIYAIDPAAPASQAQNLASPKYVSLRQTRRSGNCVLVGAGGSSASASASADNGPVLATTLYRFGLGKAPMMRILPLTSTTEGQTSPTQAFADLDASSKDKSEPKTTQSLNAGADEPPSYETTTAPSGFTAPMNPVSWHSRSSRFATPHGLFEWRYGNRSERKHFDANSVLALENIITRTDEEMADGPSCPKKRKAMAEVRVTVGYFVRNKEMRTSGTGRSTAGNGGRLLLDLRSWDLAAASEKNGSDGLLDEKKQKPRVGGMEEVERVAVTSCLVMLKKEVDRRRVHQAIMISGGAGGGP